MQRRTKKTRNFDSEAVDRNRVMGQVKQKHESYLLGRLEPEGDCTSKETNISQHYFCMV